MSDYEKVSNVSHTLIHDFQNSIVDDVLVAISPMHGKKLSLLLAKFNQNLVTNIVPIITEINTLKSAIISEVNAMNVISSLDDTNNLTMTIEEKEDEEKDIAQRSMDAYYKLLPNYPSTQKTVSDYDSNTGDMQNTSPSQAISAWERTMVESEEESNDESEEESNDESAEESNDESEEGLGEDEAEESNDESAEGLGEDEAEESNDESAEGLGEDEAEESNSNSHEQSDTNSHEQSDTNSNNKEDSETSQQDAQFNIDEYSVGIEPSV